MYPSVLAIDLLALMWALGGRRGATLITEHCSVQPKGAILAAIW